MRANTLAVVVVGTLLLAWITRTAAVQEGPGSIKQHYVGDSDSPEELARKEVHMAQDHYCFALRELPPDSVAACYASSGQLLLPGLPAVSGRSAIRDFLAPMAAAVAVDSTSMDTEYEYAAPMFVSEWGTYRQVAGPKGGVHDLHVGRYSALWSYNEREGRWLIVRLMMQPLPTPAPPGSPAPTAAPGK